MIRIQPRFEAGDQGEPMYMQLYRYFRGEIQTGKMRSGEQLLSVRALANELKVSRTTIELAYQQLLAEGYVESRARSGYFVADIDAWDAADGVQRSVQAFADHASGSSEKLVIEPGNQKKLAGKRNGQDGLQPDVRDRSRASAGVQSEVTADKLDHKQVRQGGPVRDEQEKPTILYDLHPTSVDRQSFPYSLWRKLSNQVQVSAQKDLLDYGDPQGEWGLRAALAKYLNRSRGVHTSPEQIVIGAGTQTLVQLFCQIIGLRQQPIAMEDPGYQDVRFVFSRLGFPVIPIPLEEDGLSLRELADSQAKVVYITPSHQYPLGMVMPYAKRIKLLQWAEETGGLIIEDDYDGEFRYQSKPIPSLQGLDTRGNVVYIGTFSKSLMPTIRASYMVLPAHLAEIYQAKFRSLDQTVSRIHQRTLQAFMDSGEWARHLRKMRTIYQKKHDTFLQMIHATMQNHVNIKGQGAGLHIVLEVQSDLSAEELAEKAEAVGVKVYSTENKWLRDTSDMPPLLLLGFGGLSVEELGEAVRRLHQAWTPYYR